jgi:hypothetical protein
LRLKKGQFTEAARLLDTSRRAISVRAVEKVEELRRGEVFEEWGVDLCCERGSAALEVVRLFPSSRDSLWTFCGDTQKRGFYVPFDLLTCFASET